MNEELRSPPRLMLVTERWRGSDEGWVSTVLGAIEGGVDTVQVRDREADDGTVRRRIERLLKQLPREAAVIVNRRTEIALEFRLGLHLPESQRLDQTLRRRLQAEARPLGRSVHGVEAARLAAGEGVDYLVWGTLFPTTSKPGHPGGGTEALRRVVAAVAPLPVLAIGGVTAERLPGVLESGARGVAVCGAIFAAADPRRAASAFQRSAREICSREG